jgi:hypothetical protein
MENCGSSKGARHFFPLSKAGSASDENVYSLVPETNSSSGI